jgi:hypothetical protein
MFEWLADKLTEWTEDFIDALVDLGADALTNLGVTQFFADMTQSFQSQWTLMLPYVGFAGKLVDVTVLATCFGLSFSILSAIVIFKIVVKLIPTIY